MSINMTSIGQMAKSRLRTTDFTSEALRKMTGTDSSVSMSCSAVDEQKIPRCRMSNHMYVGM